MSYSERLLTTLYEYHLITEGKRRDREFIEILTRRLCYWSSQHRYKRIRRESDLWAITESELPEPIDMKKEEILRAALVAEMAKLKIRVV